MRTKILKLKRFKVVLIITIISIIMAISFDFLIAHLLKHEFLFDDFLRASIIPIVITPFISWYLLGLFFEIDRIEKKMTVLASYDDLTGLLNRRFFYSSAKNLHNISKANKTEYCIIVVDLDFFKQINDNFGHAAGDKVLKSFGKTCNELVHKGDLVGRLGGEEFAFFLLDTNLYQAQIFSNKLQNKINESNAVYQNTNIRYTISVGISENRGNQELSISQVLKQADSALYTAKAKGRNRIIVFQEHDASIIKQ